jgi:hypothetical protein
MLVYKFYGLNPKEFVGTRFNSKFCSKLILTALDVWSTLSFYIFFLITMVWYVFYKWADSATLLLPSKYGGDNIYDVFAGFFLTILISKTIVVIMKILDQAKCDVYILDWELSREREYSPLDQFDIYKPRTEEEKAPIFWRSCFVANELNELQVDSRKIRPETLFMWFAWFWIGVGWRWWAQTNPDSVRDENALEPVNEFLKFFVCASLMLVIASIQWILYLASSLCGNSGSE